MVDAILAYLEVANGDPKSPEIRHHCVPDRDGRLCCKDADDAKEQLLRRTLDLLIGRSDRIPMEGRWTNLVPAFKRTLVRRFVRDLGLHRVCEGSPGDVTHTAPGDDDDEQVTFEYLQRVNGARARIAREYLSRADMMSELCVITIALDLCDDLLYEVLGGVKRTEDPAKIDALLGRDGSAIGKVQEGFLNLIDGCGGSGLCSVGLCVSVLRVGAGPLFSKWGSCLCLGAS